MVPVTLISALVNAILHTLVLIAACLRYVLEWVLQEVVHFAYVRIYSTCPLLPPLYQIKVRKSRSRSQRTFGNATSTVNGNGNPPNGDGPNWLVIILVGCGLVSSRFSSSLPT